MLREKVLFLTTSIIEVVSWDDTMLMRIVGELRTVGES